MNDHATMTSTPIERAAEALRGEGNLQVAYWKLPSEGDKK